MYVVCKESLYFPVSSQEMGCDMKSDVRSMTYGMAVLSSALLKIVPLESDLGDVPVIDHKPSKLPLFKKQYENKVFIGKSFQSRNVNYILTFHLTLHLLSAERVFIFIFL